MNPKHYCTLEVAKKLQQAGVVVETECEWVVWTITGYKEITIKGKYDGSNAQFYPALSMSEAWELLVSSGYFIEKRMYFCPRCEKEKFRDYCEPCGTYNNTPTNYTIDNQRAVDVVLAMLQAENAVDALLAIWLKGREREEQ